MKILLCNTGMAEARQMLIDLLPDHQFVTCNPNEVLAHLDGIDIVTPFMTRIDEQVLQAGQFGLVQQIGVGLENVDIAAATQLGVRVARVPAAGTGNAESVAEHAILLLLALSRQLPQAHTALQQRHWFHPRGQALAGKRACIVGLGAIGSALAVRLRALDMHLIAIRAHPERGAPPETGIAHVHGPEHLHTVLSESDYVILCVNYDQYSHHMIDAAALAALKPGAFLVNVARGGLVDTDALHAALARGHLAGAGLDVFWEEPVDPAHPIFQYNVIATPHIAGVTDLFYAGVTRVYSENIRRYARGETPLHTVNTPAWQRQPRHHAASE